MNLRLGCLLLTLLAFTQLGGMKRKPPVIVRFYPQAAASDGSSFATEIPLASGQGTIFISKIATVSEDDIESFYPFQNADGSVGTYFTLDEHGRILLQTLSMEHRGQYVAVVLNGRHVIDLLIDRPITDGIAVIPTGLAPQELALLRTKFKMTGDKSAK